MDALLGRSGRSVQHKNAVNLSASRGVAIRGLTVKTIESDYTLFVDGKAIGIIKAEPAAHSLSGVEEQSQNYVKGLPFGIPATCLPRTRFAQCWRRFAQALHCHLFRPK